MSDDHDAPRLINEPVSGFVVMVNEVVARCKNAVGEPIIGHELSDILDRVEFGVFLRQRNDADVFGYIELVSRMLANLIYQHTP